MFSSTTTRTFKSLFKKYNKQWSSPIAIAAVVVLVPSSAIFARQFVFTDNDDGHDNHYSDATTPTSSLRAHAKKNEDPALKKSRSKSDLNNSSNNSNNNKVDKSKSNESFYNWFDETSSLRSNTQKLLNDFIFDKNRNDQPGNKDVDDGTSINQGSERNGQEGEFDFTKFLFHGIGTLVDGSDRNDENGIGKEDGSNDDDDDSIFNMSSITNTFSELISGDVSEKTFNELINHARNRTQAGLAGEESRTLSQLINVLMDDVEKVQSSLHRNFEGLDIDLFDPTSIFYYLESEDEKKNPSWKRRIHRFCPGVDINSINDLNDALKLAELSYADTVDEIKDGLENAKIDNEKYELIYCQMESYPGQPSHFLAVKRGQSKWSKYLEVLMVVRGTKTVPDMMTDALLDATDYKGGKAHAGVLESGKYLVEKHSNVMESLLDVSKKKQIRLSIVGHSLGAGAGTIAGMELQDNPKYDVSVVGFGCPALLSKELSESASSYVTTVIGDSDMVPRMSAATLSNVILNVVEYDWTNKARRDVQQFLEEVVLSKQSFLSIDSVQSIIKAIDTKILKILSARIKKQSARRMIPRLYPPGKCIHFYRDGVAVSGALTPATFFNEIDVSRTMIDDHYIEGYRRIFLGVMRKFHNDEHFSFDRIGRDIE